MEITWLKMTCLSMLSLGTRYGQLLKTGQVLSTKEILPRIWQTIFKRLEVKGGHQYPLLLISQTMLCVLIKAIIQEKILLEKSPPPPFSKLLLPNFEPYRFSEIHNNVGRRHKSSLVIFVRDCIYRSWYFIRNFFKSLSDYLVFPFYSNFLGNYFMASLIYTTFPPSINFL